MEDFRPEFIKKKELRKVRMREYNLENKDEIQEYRKQYYYAVEKLQPKRDRSEYFREYQKRSEAIAARNECQRRYREKLRAEWTGGRMPTKEEKEAQINACITELFRGFNIKPKRKN